MNIQDTPIVTIVFATITIILLSIEVGYRFGTFIGKRSQMEKESPVSVISGAILGLLAFMLAFTFGILYNRYDARKDLVRTEANAISTTWLRAEFMSEPDRQLSRKLLKDYVDLRIAFVQSPDVNKMQSALDSSSALQQRLWDLAVTNARKDMNSDVAALYVESLNEVLDIHGLRLARGYQAKTPEGLWIALYILLMFSMLSIGYQTAISGSRRTWSSMILAISFTIVFVLVAALDQPTNGFFEVSQQPLINVQSSISEPSVNNISTPIRPGD
jgi:Protein of unknown function (DUF4239)